MWVLDFRATGSTCVPHGKLVPESITCGCKPERTGEGGGKEYFQLLQEDRGNTCEPFFESSLTSRLVTTNPTP